MTSLAYRQDVTSARWVSLRLLTLRNLSLGESDISTLIIGNNDQITMTVRVLDNTCSLQYLAADLFHRRRMSAAGRIERQADEIIQGMRLVYENRVFEKQFNDRPSGHCFRIDAVIARGVSPMWSKLPAARNLPRARVRRHADRQCCCTHYRIIGSFRPVES